MFCPECRGEFREGYTKCAECGVALVAELPEEAVPEYRELTTVMTVTDVATLSAAKDALDAAGIDCLADGEQTQAVFGGLGSNGLFTPLVGPVRLQVPEADAARAKEILAELEVPSDDDLAEDDASEDDALPEEASEDSEEEAPRIEEAPEEAWDDLQ